MRARDTVGASGNTATIKRKTKVVMKKRRVPVKKNNSAINEIPEEFIQEVVLVTPQQAKQWLEFVDRNNQRNLKRSLIHRLHGYMNRGEWLFTGDPIRFDTQGRLVDGQHRLTTLIEADVSAYMLVQYGLSDQVYQYIDQGAIRTIGDMLKGRTALAGAVRMLHEWQVRGYITYGTLPPEKRANIHELIGLVADHPELEVSDEQVTKLWRQDLRKMGYPSVQAVFLHYVFSQHDEEEADKFFEDLTTGANLAAKDPVLVLRKTLMSYDRKMMAQLRGRIMALTIKAWNFRRRGKTVHMYKFLENEDFPQPI